MVAESASPQVRSSFSEFSMALLHIMLESSARVEREEESNGAHEGLGVSVC